MTHVVLDANVAIDWFAPSPEGEAYSRKLERLAVRHDLKFAVPLHFDIEVARILRKKHKRQPLIFSETWFKSSLQILDLASIQIVAQGLNFQILGDLSIAYNLDVPDVPYFHLARMMDTPIASRDRGIIAACKAWGVTHWQP